MTEENEENSEAELATEPIKKEPVTPKAELQEITVRSYPKTVLFYPMVFVSLFISIALVILSYTVAPFLPALYIDLTYTLTFIWLVFFFANLLIVTFEFGKNSIVAIVLIIVVIILIAALVFTVYGFIPWINPALLGLLININSLLAFTLIFVVAIFLAWIKTRFYYFSITPNEIIYKKGIMGDVERYGTTNVMFHKEIIDVFEFLIFRSGRLTFTIPGRKTAIVLDNVPNVNKIEMDVLYLLRRIDVDID